MSICFSFDDDEFEEPRVSNSYLNIIRFNQELKAKQMLNIKFRCTDEELDNLSKDLSDK